MTTVALAPDELLLPRRFGQYLLFDKIGEGGMARIYLGRKKTSLGGERLVVVKQILPVLAASEEFCRLIVDEAKISATLSHKNIVQVNDLGREGGGLYIAMEYVEGLDLRELLRYCSKNSVPLPLEFAFFIVTETLRGLDHAHRKRDDEGRPLGIIHRDVSPSNVLLSLEGEVKLCDFGIARAVSTGDVLPEEAIQGKAGYMSPEAARGEALDQRSDLFSVGIILYELLSGRRMYRSSKTASLLDQARLADVPALPKGGRPDDATLERIVAHALAVNPEERYASANAMLRDLEEYIGKNRLIASPLRLGDWLAEHFGETIIARRREWERAAKTLEASGSLPPPARAGDSEAPAAPPQPGKVPSMPPRRSSAPPGRTSEPPRPSRPSRPSAPAVRRSSTPSARPSAPAPRPSVRPSARAPARRSPLASAAAVFLVVLVVTTATALLVLR
jgi:eukaryotic-like serine/threonine-protein kinase